jgi:hypothetical protein
LCRELIHAKRFYNGGCFNLSALTRRYNYVCPFFSTLKRELPRGPETMKIEMQGKCPDRLFAHLVCLTMLAIILNTHIPTVSAACDIRANCLCTPDKIGATLSAGAFTQEMTDALCACDRYAGAVIKLRLPQIPT